MSDWKDEFDRRCRRLLGVTDDTLPVRVYTHDSGDGCDTCGYGASNPVEITCGNRYATYSDLADLIRQLDEVEL